MSRVINESAQKDRPFETQPALFQQKKIVSPIKHFFEFFPNLQTLQSTVVVISLER